jgi:Mce-associated membrane protein
VIGGRGAMLALAGLAGLLLVLAVMSGWQGTTRLTDRSDETAAVEEAARSFVEAYGTFDFRDPDSYRERLLALTTGSVREAVAASEVDPVALGQQRTMSTRVVAVEVTALSEDGATASITAEQRRRGSDPTTRRLTEERVEQRVACRLVREGDHWLVTEFRLLSEEPIELGAQS